MAEQAIERATSFRGLRSLRLRLTLWVVAIAAIVKLSVMIVALLYQARAIRTLFDDQLRIRAAEIIQALPPNPADVTGERLHQLALHTSEMEFFSEVRLAVYNLEGTVVAYDPAMHPLPRPAAVHQVIEKGGESFVDRRWRDDTNPVRLTVNYREYATPITAGSSAPPGLVLWIASSDAYVQERIFVVRRAVILTATAGMFGTIIAGWFIAGIAVHPLDRLRLAISHLSAERMSLEVDEERTSPEVAELREELDRAMHRIENGYKAYGRFIANVSHELKTPIAVSLSEAQVLMHDPNLSDAARRFAQSTAEEMSRLGRLIESFLTLTRVRGGRLDATLQEYQVNELVMDSIEHCAAYARQQGVTLLPTLIISEGDDACVNVDPDMMRSAIDNLIRNAIRFTPPGGKVEVTASADEVEQFVSIAVRDYGPGIPQELLPTLFDRFTQSETEVRSGRGTGLGLEISQGIAELHDGSIEVENLDRGCVFTLTMPMASAEECEDETGECEDEPGDSETKELQK
ncbi:MAG: sensor histidine kinase [Phycisphaerales bacterium]